MAFPRRTSEVWKRSKELMKNLSVSKQWARKLKIDSFTLYYAYKNPRTPWYAKIWAAVVVAYAFSPIDLIPDFIPIVGYLDDLVLIPLGMALAIKLIPRDILEECRRLANDRANSRKPFNWVAGGIIIAIWAAVLTFIIYRIVRSLS
jgi:uncharacterized membrane protein YkvA (DUF1232 family)